MGSMEDAFRKAGVTPAPPEPLPEKPCARCGKAFRPGRPQHKLCPECITAVRAERATEGAAKPAESPDKAAAEKPSAEKPAEADGAAVAAATAPEARPRRVEGEREHPRRAEGARPRRAEGERERPPRRVEGARERPAAHAEARPPRTVPFPGSHGLPASYLSGGYFASNGALRPELLTSWAEQIAHGVASTSGDSSGQHLRAFYNHVKRAAEARKFGRQPIEGLLNEIQKLKPFAVERAARRKVPDLFRQFLEANVDQVTDEHTLLAFFQHFQAVMAYTSGLLQLRKERR